MTCNENSVFIPKFKNGAWAVDSTGRMCFTPAHQMDRYPHELFWRTVSERHELLFQTKFQRARSTRDGDRILIQDIKDVVLFFVKPKQLSPAFIDFFHTETVDNFLNALVIYFEYYLKLLEFMAVRRDEMRHSEMKTRSPDSDVVEHMLSEHMMQYRIMLARSYSRIVLGVGDVQRFHHMANGMRRSYGESDRRFNELFFPCCQRFVWIAHHRRVPEEINYEFDRLFRSEYFQMSRHASKLCQNLSDAERRLLYGRNNVAMQQFSQQAPVILELMRMEPKHAPLLWLTDRRYEGDDCRVKQLELEYTVAEAQLYMANVQHGILGHPRHLYNTWLDLNWTAVRKERYSMDFDPYGLIRQPLLRIPDWRAFSHAKEEHNARAIYEYRSHRFDAQTVDGQRRIWKRKDTLMRCANQMRLGRDICREVWDMIK